MKAKIIQERRVDSPNVAIFVPGSWEAAENRRTAVVSRMVAGVGLASTVLYESARNWGALTEVSTTEDWIGAFDGKTFWDELRDLLDVINYVQRQYAPEQIFLSGYSYGGALAIVASGEGISALTRMVLVAPQIVPPLVQPNIYQEFPPEAMFCSLMARYRGQVTFIAMADDVLVPPEHVAKLYNALRSARGRYVLTSSDHALSDADGLATYVEEHMQAFRRGGTSEKTI